MGQPLRSGALFFGGFGPACHHRLHDGFVGQACTCGNAPSPVGAGGFRPVLACLGYRGKRGTEVCFAAPAEREGVRDGRSARTGSSTRLPRTAFFILSPALPRLRDDTLRGALRRLVARPRRLHRCRRGLGGGGHRLPEQVDRRAASAQDPDRRRVRLPRPVRTVSGLRHRRLGRVPRETGPPSIAKVRTTIKNKTGTYLLLVSTRPRAGDPDAEERGAHSPYCDSRHRIGDGDTRSHRSASPG
jgi:hypothetical protein